MLIDQKTKIAVPTGTSTRKLFWLTTGGHFTCDLYNGFLAPLLPIIVIKLDISLALAGLLITTFAISTSLLQPVAGFVADRVRRYYFVLFGPVVAAVFMGFIGWVEHYWMLVAILIASGTGIAMLHPQGAAVVGGVINKRRGFYMSVFNMAGSLGVTTGSILIIPLTSAFGLKATIVTVVPAVILFCYSVRPLIGSPVAHPVGRVRTDSSASVRPYLRPLLSLFFIVVIRATIILTFMGFIPLYLTSQGQSPLFGGIALGVYQFFITIGILLGGHLFDRFGARRILVLSFVFTFPFAFGFVNYPSAWGLPFLAIMGLFGACSTPVNIIVAQEIIPGKANFISAIMMGLAWGVAGLLVFPAGIVADHIGLYGTLIIASSLAFVGLALAWFFPDHGHLTLTEGHDGQDRRYYGDAKKSA